MKKGYDRLRGVAAASAIGVVGLLGGGSARAATPSIPLTVTRGSAAWSTIGNNSSEPFFSTHSITTTGGFSITALSTGFAIGSASLTGPIQGDFYDGGMALAVGNAIFKNPIATVDLTGDVLTTDTVVDITLGVDAEIEYYFHPTRAVVRGVYTLTNTSGAPITTTALVMGNYGSDTATTVQATESGDPAVTDADKWVVTNDSAAFGTDSIGDPTATIAVYGDGATVTPRTVMTLGTPAGGAAAGPDNYGYRYDLTIPGGATCRIMVFNEMTTSIAAATLGAADFISLAAADAAGLLTGLTPAEQGTIINYAPGTACTPSGNSAPVLAAIGDQSVTETVNLAFTATATDADIADTLAFTLDAASIALGMSIDPVTGLFSWTPNLAQGTKSYPVTVTVTDDGAGTLSDSEIITVTVFDLDDDDDDNSYLSLGLPGLLGALGALLLFRRRDRKGRH